VVIGREPEPTESQAKAVEKLASKLYTRPPKNNKIKEGEEEANEDILDFDMMDTPRVILFDGRVLKKSKLYVCVRCSFKVFDHIRPMYRS
jgi:DNA primase catalytic subunit